jgi:hypothetical protein
MRHTSDDLKTIKGIAETRENWLQKIGVHTIEGLAASEAIAIHDKLQTAGHAVPLIVIEDWITKAKIYVSTSAAPAIVKTSPSAKDEKNDTSLTEWKTFAEFFIDYQHRATDDGNWEQRTKVHRMRNGGKDNFWEGLAGEPVGRWMLEQLDEVESRPLLKKARPSPVPRPSKPQKPPSKLALSIQEVELLQQNSNTPIHLHETGRAFSHPIHSETPFDLRTIFEIEGEVNAHNGSAPHIAIQAYTTNKSTGETILLGESEPQQILSDKTKQTIKLSDIRLSQGTYRLQLMLRVIEQPGTLGFLEVPYLWVM